MESFIVFVLCSAMETPANTQSGSPEQDKLHALVLLNIMRIHENYEHCKLI